MTAVEDTAVGIPAMLPAKPPGAAVTAMKTEVLSHRVGAGGLCSDSADNKWFPEGMYGSQARPQFAEYARAACLGCSVMQECLELSLRIEASRADGSHGVWGGTAPWERRAMIRTRKAVPHD